MKSGKSIKNYDLRARRINGLLDTELKGLRTIGSADIKHVIAEKSFTKAIQEARDSLDLKDYYPDTAPEEDIDHWILLQVAGGIEKLKSAKAKHQELQRFIDNVIFYAVDAANLQSGWFTYVQAYIALGKPPVSALPTNPNRIFVESVSDDNNHLLVRLERGLSAEEYRTAWKAFKDFVNKPTNGQVYAEVTKNKIYLDRLNGMSYGQLAKKYYPNEYEKDTENKTDYTRDKVKKIVARFKTAN